MRHGEATPTSENPQRPLTIAGRQHAERVSSWLAEQGYEIDEVRHSGKVRARQTAKILGHRLDVPVALVREVAGFGPHGDPAPFAGEIESDRRSVALVGHLPLLNRLASTLLVGDPDRIRFRFGDAGAVVLEWAAGGWQVVAVVGHEGVSG
jgi:phosphohistidine phosphatase